MGNKIYKLYHHETKETKKGRIQEMGLRFFPMSFHDFITVILS